MSLLTKEEQETVELLADAWNKFVKLESLHPDETTEFRTGIHEVQKIIMARPVQREFNKEKKK